ncbi:CheR family methyltransferase [Saccharicrinis sp. FJH54]|uniref:CheR family methyltransferase n=1 Tax=Saccharicrinis sp. FJH54 TaxID=3344665 RepID=UPI0035D3E9F3
MKKHKDIPDQILTHLKQQTGLDFNTYKPNTLIRRINKRFSISGTANLEEYFEVLKQSPQETEALKNDILIGVTSFYRDTDIFDFLYNRVIPKLTEAEHKLRIWVAGCSTGEEAYTFAMILENYIQRNNLNTDFKIFATDVSAISISYAGKGCYSEIAMDNVSEQDRKNFFELTAEGYCIKKFLREKIVFAQHNLLADPPFIKMDLISCRNLLIYLQGTTQEKVLENFIFSLKPNSYLLLGNSENLGSLKPYFKVIDSKWKLFQLIKKKKRVNTYKNINVKAPLTFNKNTQSNLNQIIKSTSMNEFSVHKILENLLPPLILLDHSDNIKFIKGDLSKYLKVDQGVFQPNLIKMIEKETAIILKKAISQVKTSGEPVTIKKLKMNSSQGAREVKLKIFLIENEEQSNSVAILFMNENPLKKDSKVLELPKLDKISEQRIKDLEKEQAELENDNLKLQQELDYIKEKMQTSNEELLASNEELQATNEELQSVNEELNSLNTEYSEKNTMLIKLNDDMNNLLDSTEIATIFLDRDLKIKNFTPVTQQLFNIQQNDIGRPFNSFSSRFNNNEIDEIIKHAYLVLKNSETIEKEVSDLTGYTYIRRIGPYKTNNNLIEGVVITFIDITGVKESQRKIRESEAKYKKLISTMPSSFALYKVITDSDGNPADAIIIEVNHEYENISGIKADKLIGKPITRIWPDRYASWLDLFAKILKDQKPLKTIVFSEKKDRYFEVTGYIAHEGYIVMITNDVTEKYLSDQALKESEEKYRNLVDNSLVGVYLISQDGNILYANEALIGMLEFKNQEELAQSDVFSLSSDPDESRKVLHELINKGSISNYETKLKSRTNREITVLLSAKLSGNLIRGMVIDITERIKYQHDLNIFRERFSLATKASNIGIWDWNLADESVYYSPIWKSQLGYSPDELPDKFETWNNLLHPEDRERANQRLLDYIKNPIEYFEIEFRLKHKNGDYIWIFNKAASILDEKGKVIRMFGAHTDITDRKAAEEELKITSQRLQLATRSAFIGIWELDFKTNSLMWDDQMFKIYGLERKKFSNYFEGWKKSLHPNDRDKAMQEFDLAVQGIKDYKTEFHIIHPDNSVRCIHAQAVITKNTDGSPAKMIGVNWDITDEEEIKSELIKAKEKAEIANVHKNNFLANMSHEIRTPMNGIIGFAELLKEDHTTAKQKDLYLEIINNNSQSLLSLIDDIIDISKIEANEIKIFKEPVEISELIHQLKTEYDQLKATRNKKHIEIVTDTDPELDNRFIRTDKLRLRQILVNLINNALKFTEEGKITIGYKTKNKKIEFFVYDEGVGIPEAKATEIFERFYRLDTKTHRKYRGTGLGLAISKGLTDLLGGTIWVDTSYTNGASIHFTIPYKESVVKNEKPEISATDDSSGNLNGVNILLVEDEENIVTFFKEALKDTGVEVMWVDSGEKAVKEYKKHAKYINAVLMDINLPGMDGTEATEKILKIDPSATVIAQTAYAMPEEIEKCLKAGCVDYLTKPIKPQMLIGKLKKYC